MAAMLLEHGICHTCSLLFRFPFPHSTHSILQEGAQTTAVKQEAAQLCTLLFTLRACSTRR